MKRGCDTHVSTKRRSRLIVVCVGGIGILLLVVWYIRLYSDPPRMQKEHNLLAVIGRATVALEVYCAANGQYPESLLDLWRESSSGGKVGVMAAGAVYPRTA